MGHRDFTEHRGVVRFSRVSLNGEWTLISDPPKFPAATISVPSHWTHGTAWAYPEGWSDLKAATLCRELVLPALVDGESLWLHFEAVMLRCEVILNGERIGSHDGGFTPFEFEVTPWAGQRARLEVFVRGSSSAYTGAGLEWPVSYPKDKEEGPLPAGIWQPVWLIVRPSVFLREHSIEASVSSNRITTSLTLAHAPAEERRVRVCLRSAKEETEVFVLLEQYATLPPSGELVLSAEVALGNLPLWSPASPRLLRGRLSVTDEVTGAELLDEGLRFGLREFTIEGSDFYLNGVKTHLIGNSLVRHRISPHLWRRDYLRLLFRTYRELGINCLRTHGSIAPRVVFEVADEEGMLIQNQSALWSDAVFSYVEAGERFLANAKTEFTAWFKRDRNHPSVVLWDVENEQIRILPKSRPMIEALIQHLRDLGATVPVVASGCSAVGAGDAFHEHCGPLPRNVIRRWKAQGRRKPFIHGEWWPDQTLAQAKCLLFTGMAGPTRVPQQAFGQPEAILEASAYLYARQFRSDRLEGTSGTTAFSFEQLLFAPLFPPGVPIDVASSAEEPVGFTYPDHAEENGLHLIRRPLVNPGWSETVPAVCLQPKVESALRAAFAPFLVGFLEFGPFSDAEGVFRRTLVALNDHLHAVKGVLELCVGGNPVFTTELALEAGEQVAFPLEFRDVAGSAVASWKLDEVGHGEADIGRLRTVESNPESSGGKAVLRVSGLRGETVTWLQRRGWHPVDASTSPPEAGVWLMGQPETCDPETVQAFLQSGGTVIALPALRQPRWIPAVVAHQSSLSPSPQTHREWGMSHPGRELAGILQAPVYHRDHPIFDGLTLHQTPWCPQGAIGEWNADDERVADDTYRIAPADRSAGLGHVDALVGGPHQRDLTLAEITLDRGRILLCQLHIETNLSQTSQAARLFENILRHASRPASQPEARFILTGTIPRDFPALGDSRAHQPAESRAWIHFTDDAGALSAEQQAWVKTGGTLVRLPASEGGFEVGVSEVKDEAALILTPPNTGEPLLAGVPTLTLQAAVPSESRVKLLPLAPAGSVTSSVVPAWSVPQKSPIAGMQVRGPVGDLWQRRSMGAGEVHTIATAFGGNSSVRRAFYEHLLRNLKVPVPFPEIRPPEVPTYAVHRTLKPLPLDGDVGKWTNDELDTNIAPWSHAQRAEMVAARDPDFPGIRDLVDRRRCAAFAYVLYDDNNCYVCIGGVAPAIAHPPPGAFIWFYSGVSITLGFHHLVFTRDSSGGIRHVIVGSILEGAESDLRLAVHDFDRLPAHPAFARLDLLEPETLKAQVYEAAIPWALFGHGSPRTGEEIALQLKYLTTEQPDGRKTGDLVAPPQIQPDNTPFQARFTDQFRD